MNIEQDCHSKIVIHIPNISFLFHLDTPKLDSVTAILCKGHLVTPWPWSLTHYRKEVFILKALTKIKLAWKLFKVFTGKEVAPLHEEGNSLQVRAGKKATHFHYKWFIDIWQTDKTERRERSQCEMMNWKYVLWWDEQMKPRLWYDHVAMSGTR